MPQLIDKKNKIILYLIFFLILSTTNNKITNNEKKIFTKIKKIEIIGSSNDNNFELLNKLNIFFSKNIFNIEGEKIHKIISKKNIIEEYRVDKIYPSALNIDIKPTKFIAKLSDNSKFLVGSNGKLIKNQTIDKTIPYLFGEFNSKEFLNFKKKIDRSSFSFTDFKSIFFYPSNRWDILTTDDILIKLPKDNLLETLNQAYIFINDSEFQNNKIIDLRIFNQLIVK